MPTRRTVREELAIVRSQIESYYVQGDRRPLSPREKARYEALLNIEKRLMDDARRRSQDSSADHG